MKKYVKPMMESEAFVANEFVSSCWTVTCDNCGAWEEGYDILGETEKYRESICSPGIFFVSN